MGEPWRRFKLALAWYLLEACYLGERLLWEHYGHDLVEVYILPDLAREVVPPPESPEHIDFDIPDEIPF